MAKRKDEPQFVAEVLVTALVEVPVYGKTLDEARESAKDIKRGDVVTEHGDLMDGQYRVTGVRDGSAWSKLEI